MTKSNLERSRLRLWFAGTEDEEMLITWRRERLGETEKCSGGRGEEDSARPLSAQSSAGVILTNNGENIRDIGDQALQV